MSRDNEENVVFSHRFSQQDSVAQGANNAAFADAYELNNGAAGNAGRHHQTSSGIESAVYYPNRALGGSIETLPYRPDQGSGIETLPYYPGQGGGVEVLPNYHGQPGGEVQTLPYIVPDTGGNSDQSGGVFGPQGPGIFRSGEGGLYGPNGQPYGQGDAYGEGDSGCRPGARYGRGGGGIELPLLALSGENALTSDQKTQIQTLMKNDAPLNQTEMQTAMTDRQTLMTDELAANPDSAKITADQQAILKDAQTQLQDRLTEEQKILGILTPDQRQAISQFQQQGQAEMQNRGGIGLAGGSAPPGAMNFSATTGDTSAVGAATSSQTDNTPS